MAVVNYRNTSPYAKTLQASWYLSYYNYIDILKSEDDVIATIPTKYLYRPDLFSYNLYGTSDYWWVFMVRNMDSIKDPIFDFIPGKQIYIPKKENITRI